MGKITEREKNTRRLERMADDLRGTPGLVERCTAALRKHSEAMAKTVEFASVLHGSARHDVVLSAMEKAGEAQVKAHDQFLALYLALSDDEREMFKETLAQLGHEALQLVRAGGAIPPGGEGAA